MAGNCEELGLEGRISPLPNVYFRFKGLPVK